MYLRSSALDVKAQPLRPDPTSVTVALSRGLERTGGLRRWNGIAAAMRPRCDQDEGRDAYEAGLSEIINSAEEVRAARVVPFPPSVLNRPFTVLV